MWTVVENFIFNFAFFSFGSTLQLADARAERNPVAAVVLEVLVGDESGDESPSSAERKESSVL